MSPLTTALIIEGPLRGEVVSMRGRHLTVVVPSEPDLIEWAHEDRYPTSTLATSHRVLTARRLRVGRRTFNVWAEGEPSVTDAVLALIDAKDVGAVEDRRPR
jgi:hypothetical protein